MERTSISPELVNYHLHTEAMRMNILIEQEMRLQKLENELHNNKL
jgi:hypothetical protein